MVTTDTDAGPHETSPLLPKQAQSPDVTSAIILPESLAATNEATNEIEANGSALPSNDEDEAAALAKAKAQLLVVFPALTIGVLLSAADQTIVVASYARIGSDLNALNKTSWIASAYFLTLTSFQPLYGKLSDIFQRKPCLLIAYTILTIGCLACGLAPSMNQLIAWRAFTGIGGGGLVTVTSIILSDVVPLRERGTWQGYVNLIYATGGSLGAPLGGLLADSIGWRWAFLGQVPLSMIAMLVVGLFLHLSPTTSAPGKAPVTRESTGEENGGVNPVPEVANDGQPSLNSPNDDWKAKLKRVDFLGAIFLIAGVFSLLFGLDRGSNTTWTSLMTLVPLCVSLPLFAIFLLIERLVAAEPFVPGHIIFARSLFPAYAANFFHMFGYIAALFYVPLHLQAVNGLTATQSGVCLIPLSMAAVTGSLLGGYYMQRTGRYYRLTVVAYHSLALGLFLVYLAAALAATRQVWMLLGAFVIGAIGGGVGVTTSLIALISNAAQEEQAVVTACSYLFRSLGATTGVSVSATLANATLRSRLAARLPRDGSGSGSYDPDEIARQVRLSLIYIRSLPPAIQLIVRECYRDATRNVFFMQFCAVLGAAAAAWFIREASLKRK